MDSANYIYSKFKECGLATTDSRNIAKGAIFFALKGANFDGNKFAYQALEMGASLAVVDDKSIKGENIVVVDNVLTTLQRVARIYRDYLNIPIVGLTGTNGKTTTKELITAVLSSKYRVASTKGNLNNHIGVPLTILSIPFDCEIAVVEMGANHIGDIAELTEIANPNYGLITNVGKAHLEGFGSFEGVKKAKGELYDYIKNHDGLLFLNSDNPYLSEMVEQRHFANFVPYGKDVMNISVLLKDLDHPFLRIEIGSGSLSGLQIDTQIVGDYNLDNVLAAVTIGRFFKVDDFDIKKALESYSPDNNRSQLMRTKQNLVIADCYNANPTSMEAALANFASYNIPNKVAILGDMLELGLNSKEEHQKIVELTKQLQISMVYFVGKEFGSVNMASGYYCFNNSNELLEYLVKNPIHESLVLVKGSRGIRLESSLPLL